LNEIGLLVEGTVNEEENACSQTSIEFVCLLNEILNLMKNKVDYLYFKSEKAREHNSNARKIVESAADVLNTFSSKR
jgi:hypothetical protein